MSNSVGISLEFIGCVKTPDHLDLVGTVYEGDMYHVTTTGDMVVWSDACRGWVKVGTSPAPDYDECLRELFASATLGELPRG